MQRSPRQKKITMKLYMTKELVKDNSFKVNVQQKIMKFLQN
jgi:hypothetical protein